MDTKLSSQNLSIGKKVAIIRRVRGYTQNEVSKKLNISFQTLSRIETSNSIRDNRLQQLAEVFEVSVDAIKNFKEEYIFLNNHYTEEEKGLIEFKNLEREQSLSTNKLVEKVIELYELLLKKKLEENQQLKAQVSNLKSGNNL